MTFERLDERDQQMMGECLRAAAEGPFIPEWEFHTLFGLYRWEVANIAAAWPNVDDADEVAEAAINNSLLHLWGYPIDAKERWAEYISAPRDELERVLDEWRRLKQLAGGSTSCEYFNWMM
jgi:hypothetical protein